MAAPDFQALAQPGIQRLRAYDPGHDLVALRRRFTAAALVELGSNENALGPGPKARQAALAAITDLHRYPDPLGGDLKRALAGSLGLSTTQILLGNGSHELLMMLSQVFAGKAYSVVFSEFGFAVYGLAAQAAGAQARAAPALPRHGPQPRGHDLEALLAAVDASTRLVYLANPNNPTGTWFPTAALAAWLRRLPEDLLVVVDEAYIEYATDPALVSAAGLLAEFPNLIVTRTFSKAHGLAGLRVGYALAHPDLVAVMERVRESFNVNGPGLAAGEAALSDTAHVAMVRARNASEREWLAAELARRGLGVTPSQTNFLLVDFARPAAPLEAALVQRGLVLRPMAGYGLPESLRVTVGQREDNLRLLKALDEVLG